MICQHCKKDLPDGSSYCCWCGKAVGKIPRKPKPYHANGSGYAFRRPGQKTYTVRVQDLSASRCGPDGKLRRKFIQKGGFTTETAARDWARDWYRHRTEKPPAPTLLHYWELYRDNELEKLSSSKKTAYNIAWNRLTSISAMAMDTLTVSDLRAVVSENGKSHYTARDMKVLLSHLFNLGAADGYCQKDLPSFIVLPDLKEKEAEAFTEDEQKKIWAAYEKGDKVAAWPLLMIYTGMMPGETQQLRVENIDLEHRMISGVGLKTKVRKNSVIYLTPTIIPVLEDLIDGRTEGKIFRRHKDTMYDDYHAFTARIGIRDLDPYSCRHTTGTALAVDMNIAPETIRKIMRWSKNSNMISRYAHPDDKDALAAVSQLTRPDDDDAQADDSQLTLPDDKIV